MSSPQERASFSVGEVAQAHRLITQADVEAYAHLTGDNDPVHLDPIYAQTAYF